MVKLWTCYACLYERIAVMMNCSSSGAALEVAMSIRPGRDEEGKEVGAYDYISAITIVVQQKAADQRSVYHTKSLNRDREFR
jgi:hypothetical protein